MTKLQKMTALMAFVVLALGYNNCGQVKFSTNASNSVSDTGTTNPPPGGVTLSPYINSVAYEDLFYPKNAASTHPDYDYNDFLTEFQIKDVATTDVKNNIYDIIIDFYPRAVGAGDDHQFRLVLNGISSYSTALNKLVQTLPMFQGAATVTLSHYDSHNNLIDSSTLPYDKDILIYSSTHAVFGSTGGLVNTSLPSGYNYSSGNVPSNYVFSNQNARVQIHLSDPGLNPLPTSIDASTFRVILHNINTNYDIDIVNVDPTNTDANGNPWGFIIPTEWQWMQEGISITNGYPSFPGANFFNFPTALASDQAKYLYPQIPLTQLIP
jgi:LruC domain-containing protein